MAYTISYFRNSFSQFFQPPSLSLFDPLHWVLIMTKITGGAGVEIAAGQWT